ncbi:MAG: hypothetical protein E6R13_02465 [Spirochaetes bacterium]|nr:MAG: hypothetical protein E6R13_02465 [Spirochaetota bacterium]
MGKIKIGFNPDNAWDYKTFRDLIRESIIEDTEIETYLITTNADTVYIDSIVEVIGMDSNNVYIVASNTDIIQEIENKGIQIYLSDDFQLIESINENSNDCVGIVVSSIPDRYRLQPKYITDLNFWIKQIKKQNNAQEAC